MTFFHSSLVDASSDASDGLLAEPLLEVESSLVDAVVPLLASSVAAPAGLIGLATESLILSVLEFFAPVVDKGAGPAELVDLELSVGTSFVRDELC